MNDTKRFTLTIFIITCFILSQHTALAQEAPLPPPNSTLALAFMNPIDHARKVVTYNISNVIQVAPASPLLVYYNSTGNITVFLDNKPYEIAPNGSWAVVLEQIPAGPHTVDVLNISIAIYVMTEAEEVAMQMQQQVSGDPWRLKWVRAITATIVAIIAGIPLGRAIRERYEDRRGTKVEEV